MSDDWAPIPEVEPGQSLHTVQAEDFNRIIRFVNYLRVDTGLIDRSPDARECVIRLFDPTLLGWLGNQFVAGAITNIFPAIVDNYDGGASDGHFTEAIYDESIGTWIDRADGNQITGTIEAFHNNVPRVQDETQGWVVGFVGDDDTTLYFGISGFIANTPVVGDVIQYEDEDGAAGNNGPSWGCFGLR